MGIWTNDIDVNIQDSSTSLFSYYLINEVKTDIILTTPLLKDTDVLAVSSGHGFTAGDAIVIREHNMFEQSRVVKVETNNITITTPISNEYSVGAKITRGSEVMNIDGSSVNKSFTFNSHGEGTTPIDITTIRISMQHSAAADDSKFGSITALTNGFYLRQENGISANLGVFKSNFHFRINGGDVVYTDKAGAGVYGTDINLDLRKIYGNVLRVRPYESDSITAIIRDNLAGLTLFRIKLLGHYTQGE